MKIPFAITLLLVATLVAVAQDAKAPVTSLSWIAGCWETSDNGRVTTERWSKATENLMIGTSQTVKGTKSVAFEFLRVVNNGHGLMYVAQPSNAKEPTAFAVKTITANQVVFENLKHDFPQRIIYKQSKPDALDARIEGKQGEKEMGMDIPMKRVKCE